MSADNFVGVRPNADGTYSIFEYGNMSVYEEDCMYLSQETGTVVESREKAIVKAHDLVKEMYVCEYGVVEMPPAATKPCGRCYMCIYERSVVDAEVQNCTGCGKPIAGGEWQVSTSEGTYHYRCEPRMEMNVPGTTTLNG